MRIIALEEHFLTEAIARESARHQDRPFARLMGTVRDRLLDLGEGRLTAMDAGGVDVQVLSVVVHHLDPAVEPTLVRDANDRLPEAVARHPARFAGFALLPMHTPDEAAVEFERAVGQLGFKGAMISGTIDGRFLDDRRFEPVFEAATRLGVPIYLHPGVPEPAICTRYYSGFGPAIDSALASAAWGWHVEAGLHALRLVLGGVFDRFPGLQIILGHMGEYLPYALARTLRVLQGAGVQFGRPLEAYFQENFHYTTSGFLAHSALLCALAVLGVDRLTSVSEIQGTSAVEKRRGEHPWAKGLC
jgi:predicted TIM-barrel fold metal-dependent hydrolase